LALGLRNLVGCPDLRDWHTEGMSAPATKPVPPLTPAAVRRADKAARRPDGTIDPYRFAGEIAAPLNLAASGDLEVCGQCGSKRQEIPSSST